MANNDYRSYLSSRPAPGPKLAKARAQKEQRIKELEKKRQPPPPSPITAAEMRAIIAELPAPQVTVNPPEVRVPKITVPTPEVNVPAPQVTVQAPEVHVPFSPESEQMLETARETRDLLLALLQSREGEIEVKITGRDDDGAIETLRITKQEIRH